MRIFDDTGYGCIHFFGKFKPEPRPALLIIMHSLVKLLNRFRMKKYVHYF